MSKSTKTQRLTTSREKWRRVESVLGLRPEEVAGRSVGASRVWPLGTDAELMNRYNRTALSSQEKVGRMADAIREVAEELKDQGEGGHEDPELVFRRQRAEAKEAHRELCREGVEARAEARLIQELVENETLRTDDAKDRRLMRWITGGGFVAALAFSLLAAKYKQPWGYAGMGTGVVFFSGGLLLRLKLLASGRASDRNPDDRGELERA